MDWNTVLGVAARALVDPQTAAFALAAIGLSVHFGFTGLLNFGQAGFMAVGAYGFAIPIMSFGAPTWLGFLIAIASATVFAFVLGIPTLRLRADYLAIVTIASAEIIRYIVTTTGLIAYTGGSNGLRGDYSNEFYAANPFTNAAYGFGPFESTAKIFWARLVAWTLVLLALLLVWAVMRSPYGRVLKGIREDEDAVRSLGKNVYAFKMQALVIGGIIGAIAGIVLVLPATIVPSQFGTQLTFFIFTALLLGGAATVLGPVVGAVLFWFVLTLTDAILRQLTGPGGIIPEAILDTTDIGHIRFIVVGVVLMLLVIFRPQGIFGNKKELAFSG